MTHRQRIQAAIRHQPPDCLPANDAFWEGTLEAWQTQGMPADVSALDYFDFDICSMSLDTSPRFEQQIIGREGPYIIYEDRYGYTVKKLEDRSGTLGFLRHFTVDREAWGRLKSRLSVSDDPAEPARIDDKSYFAHFDPYPGWDEAERKYRQLYASGRYLLFNTYGPWEASWRHRGFENQLMDVNENPEWLQEMAETYQTLAIDVVRQCLSRGMRPDGYFMVEDLAHSRGMLLSPHAWRRIFKPSVARLGRFLKNHGIDFWMHCCGNAEAIFEDLIECGLQVMQPLQVSSGLDIRALYPKYARRLSFYGNIDVRNILGDSEMLKQEVRAKISLATRGGYIFHSDHSIPPEVSFERYRWLLQFARHCFDSSR
jgi:uroporphyrinogen decarboxylase